MHLSDIHYYKYYSTIFCTESHILGILSSICVNPNLYYKIILLATKDKI